MTTSFANMKSHLDAISIKEDGGLLVSASSLSHRYWTGSLWYYPSPELAHDTSKCSVGVDLEPSLGAATDLKWVKGSSKFVAGSDSGSVMLWELDSENSMTCLAQPAEHDDLVLSVDINADNTQVVSASQDSRVKVWDLEDFVSINSYRGHYASVWCASCHPSEPTMFVTCSQDGKVLLWDTRKDRPATVLQTSYLPSMTTCVAWQPDNSQVVAMGTETGQIVLHDIKTNSQILEPVPAHCRQITRMAFSPHSSSTELQLASVSEDCTAAVSQFSIQDGTTSLKNTQHDRRHKDFVKGVAWDPRSPSLYTCSWDGQVLAFDLNKDTAAPMNGESGETS